MNGAVTTGDTRTHTHNMNLDTDLHPSQKMNSKWIINLNLNWKTIQLLEDNTDENLDDLRFGNDFRYDTKAQYMKYTIDKLDFIKIINFFAL